MRDPLQDFGYVAGCNVHHIHGVGPVSHSRRARFD